jgi:hypothetical protein
LIAAGKASIAHPRKARINAAMSVARSPRTTVPSGRRTSKLAAGIVGASAAAAKAAVAAEDGGHRTSAKRTGLARFAPDPQRLGLLPVSCTHVAKVGYFRPSRRANAARVNPLRRQASTNSARRPAGVSRRPRASRFSPVSISSVVAVALVTIAKSLP